MTSRQTSVIGLHGVGSDWWGKLSGASAPDIELWFRGFFLLTGISRRLDSSVPGWSEEGSDLSLPVARAGHQQLIVTRRRTDRHGSDAPDSVTVMPPLMATFVGPVEERAQDGLIETNRTIELTLPACAVEGKRQAESLLAWNDGRTYLHHMTWSVTPCIKAFPRGLLLSASSGDESQTVVVHCEDRPFRILEIGGEALARPVGGIPTEAKHMHRLNLPLGWRRNDGCLVTDIRITTDHPDQPSLLLGVAVAPGERAGIQ